MSFSVTVSELVDAVGNWVDFLNSHHSGFMIISGFHVVQFVFILFCNICMLFIVYIRVDIPK